MTKSTAEESRLWSLVRGGVQRMHQNQKRIKLLIFGDDIGLLLFLGALLFFGTYWRIGFLINDNWALADTLVAVADGHLHLVKRVYTPPDSLAPGLRVLEGRIYGRNYGQIFLALPVLLIIEVIASFADVNIALAGAWSLLTLAFVSRLGILLDYRNEFALLGSGGALLTFGVNAAFASPLSSRMYHLMALQLSTMIFAAVIGVVLYRLLSAVHDRRTGIFIGAATVLATPVAFWASIPKRHILISLFALVTIYAFYLSRSVESDRTALRARCVTYASVGLSAWVFPAEPLILLAMLGPLDLATARSNSPRQLAVVGVVFMLSLLPFFVTNYLITGHPIKTPWLYAVDAPAGIEGGTDNGASPASESQDGGQGAGGEPFRITALISMISGAVAAVGSPITELSSRFSRGLGVVYSEPSRVYYTFIRSSPTMNRFQATDLSLLESTPVLGLLVGVPLAAAARYRDRHRDVISLSEPARQTDVLAATYAIGIILLYIPNLPLHAMWTVRYLLPVVPVGMYFIGRLQPVRQVVREQTRLLVYSYGVLVLIGGQLLVVYVVTAEFTQGEVVQFHGLIGLITAVVVGGWIILSSLNRVEDTQAGAIALSLPLAAGTLFVLLSGLEYFVTGSFALAMSELLSEAIPLL